VSDDDQDAKAIRTGRDPGPRSGTGLFVRDPETVKRDAECVRLRSRSMSYQQIADQLGITKSQAFDGVKRAMAEVVAEPAEDARRMELEKLDRLEQAALRVLEADHEVVYQGGRTGIPDNGPRLQAVATLQRLSESRRKLLGLDRPQQLEVSGGVTYEIVGVDPKELT
jgi:hypothetical protein